MLRISLSDSNLWRLLFDAYREQSYITIDDVVCRVSDIVHVVGSQPQRSTFTLVPLADDSVWRELTIVLVKKVKDMSLDVYLTMPRNKVKDMPAKGSGIFIREAGSTREISREEWNQRYPDRESVVFHAEEGSESDIVEVYSANITNNLGEMAHHAGIYYHLWRPHEIGIVEAHQLILPLTVGLKLLDGSPSFYSQYNPANGWGDCEGLVNFVLAYRNACMNWPDADVRVSI